MMTRRLTFLERSPKFANNLSFVMHAWAEKPPLVLRSLSFFIRRLVGRPVVRGMDLAISYACNLSCAHCNVAAQLDTNRVELTDDEIIRAICQLKKAGGFYVTFTGGEVLLARRRLSAIIRAVGPKSMLFQVQTNGTLLNDEVCRELKAMGVDNVQISFDTFHESGNWREVLRIKEDQMRRVRRHGMDVFFTWLASHPSLAGPEIRDIIDFSNTHKVKIGLNFAVPQGRWAGNRRMLLTPEDSQKLRKLSRENRYLYIDLENNLFTYGCPAFSERFHVNAYGDVQPCTFFQISFGNIRTTSLQRILEIGKNHPLFRGFPNHCPPAENPDYIHRWSESDFGHLPVPYPLFFNEPEQACAVCGSPVNRPFLSGLKEVEYGLGWTGRMMACARCGLVQQVPLMDVAEALSWYPDDYIHYTPQPNGIRGFLMNIYMGRTVRLLKKRGVSPGMTLLDIGCGAGEKLAVLEKCMGLVVEGVEPNPKAAEKARTLFGLTVKTGTFDPSCYEENSVDVVRINHVIEHVPDPVGLLNGIHRVLKPGGLLVGETENIHCPSFRVFGRYWALLHLPYHLLLFSADTLKTAFDKSRFNRVSIKDIGDPPAWSLSLQNVLRRKQTSESRQSSRMKGYVAITLMSAPLSVLETCLAQGPVLEFHAKK
jgi:MoaA/NifB/PqqE/SkfB family radical SAM enzyme/SAM-dependent methyltransferase